jgi:hypothetical protein
MKQELNNGGGVAARLALRQRKPLTLGRHDPKPAMKKP